MLKYLLIAMGLLPNLAQAAGFPVQGSGPTSCESLWVERNQIANVAGACFQSPLGQAVFDNGDCVPGPPALSEDALNRIARIERAEARAECRVQTSADSVVINGRYGLMRFGKSGIVLGRWQRALDELDVFPRPANRQRSCTVRGLADDDDGFLALRSGPDVRYPRLGKLFNGNVVVSTSRCEGRWCFADSVRAENRRERRNGWFNVDWCQPDG